MFAVKQLHLVPPTALGATNTRPFIQTVLDYVRRHTSVVLGVYMQPNTLWYLFYQHVVQSFNVLPFVSCAVNYTGAVYNLISTWERFAHDQ